MQTIGQQHYIQEADTILQSSLAWHHFQYWAYDTWKKKYQVLARESHDNSNINNLLQNVIVLKHTLKFCY